MPPQRDSIRDRRVATYTSAGPVASDRATHHQATWLVGFARTRGASEGPREMGVPTRVRFGRLTQALNSHLVRLCPGLSGLRNARRGCFHSSPLVGFLCSTLNPFSNPPRKQISINPVASLAPHRHVRIIVRRFDSVRPNPPERAMLPADETPMYTAELACELFHRRATDCTRIFSHHSPTGFTEPSSPSKHNP